MSATNPDPLAIANGFAILRQQREDEIATYEKYELRAIEIFHAHPDGISENELCEMLRSEGATPSVASSSAHELREQGLAIKNWTTGVLTHAPASSN